MKDYWISFHFNGVFLERPNFEDKNSCDEVFEHNFDRLSFLVLGGNKRRENQMGFSAGESGKMIGSNCSNYVGLRSFVRRKRVDSKYSKLSDGHQLAKALTVPHLVAIGRIFLSF